MEDKYIPHVQEAFVPEEGYWIEMDTGWALALSIPECHEVVGRSSEGYRYVWMYDRMEKAYLFCFQLSDQLETVIAFPYNHAGMLLKDERAQGQFSIVVTANGLAEKRASYLHLKDIRLKRHPQEKK